MSSTTSIAHVTRFVVEHLYFIILPKSHIFYCYAGDQLAIAKETGRRIGMGTSMHPSFFD